MKNCIFCKIINGDIPCYKVNENEEFLAFLDITQATSGHTLVIPKSHSNNLIDSVTTGYLEFIQETMKKLSEKLNVSDFNLLSNIGIQAGQEVFHTHFHIVPRSKNDKLVMFDPKSFQKNDVNKLYKEKFQK
jgi:histidine triad (HIT) family protein